MRNLASAALRGYYARDSLKATFPNPGKAGETLNLPLGLSKVSSATLPGNVSVLRHDDKEVFFSKMGTRPVIGYNQSRHSKQAALNTCYRAAVRGERRERQ